MMLSLPHVYWAACTAQAEATWNSSSPPIALPGAIAQLGPWDRLIFCVLTCQSLTEATLYRILWILVCIKFRAGCIQYDFTWSLFTINHNCAIVCRDCQTFMLSGIILAKNALQCGDISTCLTQFYVCNMYSYWLKTYFLSILYL